MYDPMNQENNQNLNNQNADQNASPVQESPVQHAGEHSYSQTGYGAYYNEYQTPYGSQEQGDYSQQVWQGGQPNGQTVWDGSTYR